MISSLCFCLVGGDARQLHLASQLAGDGHCVTSLALSAEPVDLSISSLADCVLLPMPLTDSSGNLYAPLCAEPVPLSPLLDTVSPKQLLFGGKVNADVQAMAARRGLVIHDYLLRDELAIANAIPTAEGALQLAIGALPITIHQSRVLVVGFGRVGQCVATRFAALGAEVTVTARKNAQLALAESMGCAPLPLEQLGRTDQGWDLVVNTVPAAVLTGGHLANVGSPILIELASPPGGFDPDAVRALGLHYIPALGLPGKVAPVTAAKAIKKTLYHMLEELGL